MIKREAMLPWILLAAVLLQPRVVKAVESAGGRIYAASNDWFAVFDGKEWQELDDVGATNIRKVDSDSFCVLETTSKKPTRPSWLPTKPKYGQWLEIRPSQQKAADLNGFHDISFKPARRQVDGSLMLVQDRPRRSEAIRLGKNGKVAHKYAGSACARDWNFLSDGRYLRTEVDHCASQSNHSPFENAVDGHDSLLIYAADGKKEKVLAKGQVLAGPRFINSGTHIVAWVPHALTDGSPILWDLHAFEVATGKDSVIGQYSTQYHFVASKYQNASGPMVQDPLNFYATWEAHPWVLYFAQREKPGVVQEATLKNVLTGEEKRFKVPDQEWYMPPSSDQVMTILTQEKRGNDRILKAWQLPELKLVAAAPLPPRTTDRRQLPLIGERLRDSVARVFYAP